VPAEHAGEALENARSRLRLAERRYQTGVGDVIELGDAQLAFTNAAAQEVGARFNVSIARAQRVKAWRSHLSCTPSVIHLPRALIAL
jgi:outer membrane protein TolC